METRLDKGTPQRRQELPAVYPDAADEAERRLIHFPRTGNVGKHIIPEKTV
ncbi:MAG: hypothetical protein KDA81_19920 [Planctomycetaceae bacterium]|nr:hypothetical protein [Planctomycetaceae bacterium]